MPQDNRPGPEEPPAGAGKREEARQLAEEAIEELEAGNKDEAKFVLEEARTLDKAAVDEVMKEHKKA